ncbi:MAG: FitA-like ribbon-helix-helix domain-containing protein [Solirubrobacteraceae bacterium]
MTRTIQVREVPEEIHRELRARAAAADASLSAYVLRELTRVAERPPVADVLERAAARAGGARGAAIVEAVRSGRDRD